MRSFPGVPRTIIFGVTIDYQLRYHDGLYQQLADSGWDVHLIADPGPIGDRLAEHSSITVHRVDMKRNPSLVSDVRSLLEWRRLIRAVRPQIVVVGTPKAGLVGGLAARLNGVAVRLYELHGLRLESVSGWQRQALRLLERLACGAATDVLAVGHSLRSRALSERLTSEPKIRVLGAGSPNGVDIEHFSRAAHDAATRETTRAALGLTPESRVVTFIGRLTADKGLQSLGEAMVEVERRTGAHLLVVGQIDDESGRESVARLRNLLSNVVFAGDVADVAPYLAISDVFCLPSRREGLPTVILEAFAAGVPVVASRATGNIDLVEDGVTGRLVEIDAPIELAAALSDALSACDASQSMADEARSNVEQLYSRAAVQSNWIELLKTLCNERRIA